MLLSNGFLLDRTRSWRSTGGLDDLQVSVDGVLRPEHGQGAQPLRAKLEALARVAKFRVTLNAVMAVRRPRKLSK